MSFDIAKVQTILNIAKKILITLKKTFYQMFNICNWLFFSKLHIMFAFTRICEYVVSCVTLCIL